VRAGVKEILVIAQDTSAYGADLKYRLDFWEGRPMRTRTQELAQALAGLGVWVRLHYIYPYPHVDALIPLMSGSGLLPYLDVPFQHGSPRILKLMRRPAHAENTLERLRAWRSINPDLAVRSTFIVGFPGETDQDFETLLAWLREAQLDRVGCFKYSPVEGAAANALPDPVAEDTKEERYRRFMELSAEISRAKLAAKVGRRLRVLVDRIEDSIAIARSTADAPEIDGVVRFPADPGTAAGEFRDVEVTGSDAYDLRARPAA
jgi:ribosomal protein S12 methylthiotransferase